MVTLGIKRERLKSVIFSLPFPTIYEKMMADRLFASSESSYRLESLVVLSDPIREIMSELKCHAGSNLLACAGTGFLFWERVKKVSRRFFSPFPRTGREPVHRLVTCLQTVSFRSPSLGTFSASNKWPLNVGATFKTFIFLNYHSCGVHFLTIRFLRCLFARPFLAIVKETAKWRYH